MFSLIYTLGILYLIGLAWAKCKDKIQNKAFKLEQENEEKLRKGKRHTKSGQRVEAAGRMGRYVAVNVISEAG